MSLADLLSQAALISTARDETDLGRLRASLFEELRASGWGPSLIGRRIDDDDPTRTDAALLAAFVRNETQAFDVLFNRYAPRLNGYARRWLRGADAEDAVQSTFLVLFEKAPGILEHGEVNVAGYLFGTLRKVVGRAIARREAPEPEAGVDEPSPGDDGFAALVRREDAGRLARLLERACNPLEQDVVMLDLEDRSDAEIVGALGINPGHVRVTRYRAHAKLRRAIEEDAP